MRYFSLLFIGFAVLVSMPVQAQFITIARKIKAKHTSQSDVATVTIDAKTVRVYQAVIDTLTSNPKFEITRRDNPKRTVEFTRESYTVSIKVDSLAADLSHITVTAAHSDQSPQQPTDIAVNAILGIGHKLGIPCTLDKP
jgi:hypothetical protein